MNYFEIQYDMSKTPKSMSYLHCHDHYELYFLLSGEKQFFTENQMFNLNEPSLSVCRPYHLHKFEGGPFERILICFSPDFLSTQQLKFVNNLSKHLVFTFTENSLKRINVVLKKLLQLSDTMDESKFINLSLYFNYLLLLLQLHATTHKSCVDIKQNVVSKNISPITMKVMDYITAHCTEKISLTDLCKKFSISKTWLCKCFREATGYSIINYKLSQQLNVVKKLLEETRKPINDIAIQAGFSSANYMGLIFKKHIGISPYTYRYRFIKIDIGKKTKPFHPRINLRG